MEIKITKVEKDIEFIKNGQSRIENQLSDFIKKADEKYARQEKVCEIIKDVKTQDKFIKSTLITGIIALIVFIFNFIKEIILK